MKTTISITMTIDTEDYYGEYIPTPRKIAQLISKKILDANGGLTDYEIFIEGIRYPVKDGVLLEGMYDLANVPFA